VRKNKTACCKNQRLMELLNGVFATADFGHVFREFGNATPLSNTICVQTRLVVITPRCVPKTLFVLSKQRSSKSRLALVCFQNGSGFVQFFFGNVCLAMHTAPSYWLENHSGKNKTSHRIRENCTQDVNTASESRRTHEEIIEARTMCCLGKSTLDISPC